MRVVVNRIATTVQDQIALVTVQRPEALNALNLGLVRELTGALKSCSEDSRVGVIILTGAGEKAFIAGADIVAMSGMTRAEALEFGRAGQELTLVIETSAVPVIAAVNGLALGGGCEICLACHIRIASEEARFAQPEVHLGLIPGWGGTQRLPRLIGLGAATEMITTGEMISADEAHRLGLVNQVVPGAELLSKAHQVARAILKNGPAAISAALECLRAGMELPLEAGLDLEVNRFSRLFGTAETRRGLKAFIEKKAPEFRK